MRKILLVAMALLVGIPTPAPVATSYPGDNGSLFFSRLGGRYGNQPAEIYTVEPKGGGLEQLTDNELSEGGPTMSPKGTRMVFSVGGDTYDSEMFIMNADGEHRRVLVDMHGGNGGATWSPDGKLIAFWNTRYRRPGDIFTIRPDGKRLRRITFSKAQEATPVWSPDGDRIAVMSYRKTGLSEVWTMDPQGDNWFQVTHGATDCGRHGGCEDRYGGITGLDYAPYGDRIVFSANKGDSSSLIWIVHEDGTGLRELTGGQAPSWSPNGNRIAYSFQGGLYTIRVDGTDRRRVTLQENVYFVDWAVRN